MKKILLLLLTIGSLHSAAQEITGTILDEKKEPMINAVVQVYMADTLKGGAATDFDGRYVIMGLGPGYYSLLALYSGYDSMMVTGVLVTEKSKTRQNFKMNRTKGSELYSVVVRSYKKPLVNQDLPGSHTTTSEEIRVLPTTQVANVTNMAPAIYQKQRASNTNIGGARSNGTLYIVDGIRVSQSRKAQFYNPSEESYKKTNENDFRNVLANPVSTMSVDVDRASYSNIRRFINNGQKPPADAVRIEEMVNYFPYDYPQPQGTEPIAIQTELTDCPWQPTHKLLHIGLQARQVKTDHLPPSNLVFLIDVSGSMESPERLPLLVEGMKLLVHKLRAIDKVTIVTYAGNAGLALAPTPGDHKQEIIDALSRLQAGGSTAGGEGIKLAYKLASENFIAHGNNRVLLATDGDFNVGVSSDNELEDLIVKERATGIYLTCLGFGTGNFKDAKMEMMADKGNGNYDYIDNLKEARKTLVSEFGGTLFTVAKDVKAQIEFNPDKVQGYRLAGYEDRLLNTEDFKDDKKDAAEMGAGHTVTIIYEIIPANVKSDLVSATEPLKYQKPKSTAATWSDELATIKFRYKNPDGEKSAELEQIITEKETVWSQTSENVRFSAAVAMFGMLLKDSKFKGNSTYDDVLSMAENSREFDKDGYRSEFVKLVRSAKRLETQLSLK